MFDIRNPTPRPRDLPGRGTLPSRVLSSARRCPFRDHVATCLGGLDVPPLLGYTRQGTASRSRGVPASSPARSTGQVGGGTGARRPGLGLGARGLQSTEGNLYSSRSSARRPLGSRQGRVPAARRTALEHSILCYERSLGCPAPFSRPLNTHRPPGHLIPLYSVALSCLDIKWSM